MATEKEKHYWLVGRHDDVQLECIEISHPSFSRTYRFVRNHENGVQIRGKNGQLYNYEYAPITVRPSKSADNLEQSITLGIGDVGEIIPFELDRLRNGKYAAKRPIVNYSLYLMSDLTSPFMSIEGLEIFSNTPTKQGSVLTCKARDVNKSATGIVYNIEFAPTMAGFT